MNRIVFLFVFLLFFSCSKRERISYEPPLFENAEELTVEVLNEDYLFKAISFIDIYDSLLIVCDPFIDPIIHIFNKENGAFIASGGPRGKGPGELVTPTSFSFDHDKGQLYIHDLGKDAVVRFDIGKIVIGEPDLSEDIRFNNGQQIINSAFHQKDSFFILRKGMEELLATKNRFFDVEISANPTGISATDWRLFLPVNFRSTLTPNGNKYILGTTLGGIMYIYSINNSEMDLDTTRYFYEPVFERTDAIFNFDESTYGFASLYASDNYIYSTIFGEKSPKDLPQDICIFSLSGDPVVHYLIDYPIELIASDDKDIYMVIYKNGEQAIAKAFSGLCD